MEELVAIFVCAIMPIAIVAMSLYFAYMRTKRRNELIVAAMDRGQNVDEFMKNLAGNNKKSSLKSRQLNYLLCGCILTLVGLVQPLFSLIKYGNLASFDNDMAFICTICIAAGIAFLIVFAVGQRMLKNEMKQEESKALEEK